MLDVLEHLPESHCVLTRSEELLDPTGNLSNNCPGVFLSLDNTRRIEPPRVALHKKESAEIDIAHGPKSS